MGENIEMRRDDVMTSGPEIEARQLWKWRHSEAAATLGNGLHSGRWDEDEAESLNKVSYF